MSGPSTDAALSAHAAPQPVPAVVRAAALMDALARARQPMSMSRLASELQLPRSSVHGLCHTLVGLGFLRRAADGQLALGPRVMRLAEAFVASVDVAREFDALWQAMAEPTEETVLLSVLDGADVLYLATRNGSRPLGLAFNVGMRLPAHLTATGKALLAYSDAAEVRRLLGTGPLAPLTERSATDPEAVLRDLAATRRRGYSVDDEGVRLGVLGIGAPVLDAGGRVLAGLGISLNKAMLGQAEANRHCQRLLETARALTERLGGLWPGAEAGAPTALPSAVPFSIRRSGATRSRA